MIDIIVDENNFNDYKVIENKNKISFVDKFFSMFAYSKSNKICEKLSINFNVMLPTFFENCFFN